MTYEIQNIPEEAIQRFSVIRSIGRPLTVYTVLITSDHDGIITSFRAVDMLFDGDEETLDLTAATEVLLGDGERIILDDSHALFMMARPNTGEDK